MGSITSTPEEEQGPVKVVTEQVANAGRTVSNALKGVTERITGALSSGPPSTNASPAPTTSGGRRRAKKKNAIKSAKKSRKNKTKTKKTKSRSNK